MEKLQLIELSGWIAIFLFSAMFIFQFILAFGAPLGNFAWGGKYKILPFYLRLSSFISALIFLSAIFTVTERTRILFIINRPDLITIYIWFLTGLFGLSTVGNIISGSKWEKRIMTPIAFVSFLLCLISAVGI